MTQGRTQCQKMQKNWPKYNYDMKCFFVLTFLVMRETNKAGMDSHIAASFIHSTSCSLLSYQKSWSIFYVCRDVYKVLSVIHLLPMHTFETIRKYFFNDSIPASGNYAWEWWWMRWPGIWPGFISQYPRHAQTEKKTPWAMKRIKKRIGRILVGGDTYKPGLALTKSLWVLLLFFTMGCKSLAPLISSHFAQTSHQNVPVVRVKGEWTTCWWLVSQGNTENCQWWLSKECRRNCV